MYSQCNDTVTVYRCREGEVTRRVLEGCHYAPRQEEVEDALGKRWETKFLMILPGPEAQVSMGDRVLEGIGPEVEDIHWPEFVPFRVPGLAVVSYVRPCRLQGEISHWEVGRR